MKPIADMVLSVLRETKEPSLAVDQIWRHDLFKKNRSKTSIERALKELFERGDVHQLYPAQATITTPVERRWYTPFKTCRHPSGVDCATCGERAVSKPKNDPVNPSHYKQHPSGIEAIDVCEHLGFCVGNAVKCCWRAGLKGSKIEDLKKARWYLEREITRLEKEEGKKP